MPHFIGLHFSVFTPPLHRSDVHKKPLGVGNGRDEFKAAGDLVSTSYFLSFAVERIHLPSVKSFFVQSMPTSLPGTLPSSVDSVEKLLVYALDMYNRVAAGRYYSERTDSDRRPFLQASIDTVFGAENQSQTFIIFRGAVPLNPNYALNGETLWQGSPGLSGSITLPPGFTA